MGGFGVIATGNSHFRVVIFVLENPGPPIEGNFRNKASLAIVLMERVFWREVPISYLPNILQFWVTSPYGCSLYSIAELGSLVICPWKNLNNVILFENGSWPEVAAGL